MRDCFLQINESLHSENESASDEENEKNEEKKSEEDVDIEF